MQVLVETDSNIDLDATKIAGITADVESALERFHDLTLVSIHLRDESAGRETGDDIRCLIEARPARQQPVIVTHHAPTVIEALRGATDKIETLLTNASDRRDDRRGRDTIRGH